MSKRIATDGVTEAVVDPLKVIGRVVTHENAPVFGDRLQPLLELREDNHRVKGSSSHLRMRRVIRIRPRFKQHPMKGLAGRKLHRTKLRQFPKPRTRPRRLT